MKSSSGWTVGVGILALASLMLLAPSAWAQQASSIAGVARDTSGAVLPGVTVEAASPALIEKVRVVATNSEGRYNITELRPGTYVVTFTLTGFNTFKREGIILTAGFTATVNGDMRVGGLEETITVTGQAPLVDTQNTRQQTSVSAELLAALPTGSKSLNSYLNTLTVGLTGLADVGGASGLYYSNNVRPNAFRGKNGVKMSYDGMRANNMSDSQSYIMNPATTEEVVVETGGITAESNSAGLGINMVPKEGGNIFRGMASGTFLHENLQADNLNDELRVRGLKRTAKVLFLYDTNVTLGGPIRRDKLWFFVAARMSGNKNEVPSVFFNTTQGTPFYTPGDPAYRREYMKSVGGRVTWQASEKNKINGFADPQSFHVLGTGAFEAPESYTCWRFWPGGLYQASWSSPRTSKMLVEAGASFTPAGFPCPRETHLPDLVGSGNPVSANDISILEASNNFRYNSKSSYANIYQGDRYVERFSVSYVTGSHAIKAGLYMEQGIQTTDTLINQDLSYTFLNKIPNTLTQFATPYIRKERMVPDLGLFIQDKWMTKRLTLSYGLRFDYLNAYVAEQHVDPTRFLPFARDFARVDGVPEWTDLNPRVGASYDLFGNGRTALKASLGRYVALMGVGLAGQTNPINTSVNSVTRTWNDVNKNFAPDCNLLNPAENGECGAFQNQNFGKNNPNATRFSESVLRGFGARDSLWDLSVELDHQFTPTISATGGYYRNWSNDMVVASSGLWRTGGAGNQRVGRVTDNLAVTPSDYDPFCVTAPIDPRLPDGGGYPVCGLYDVKPTKFGKVDNFVTKVADYGDPSRYSDFVGFSVSTRFRGGILLGGGMDTGRTVADTCFVVDSQMELLNCKVVTPFKAQTQFKMNGSYPLPAGLSLAATLQNLSGAEVQANWPAPNKAAAPTLGRNLAACGTRTLATCTATVTVPLVVPQTMWEARRTQFDLRLSKRFTLSSTNRLQVNFDFYNLFNASSVLSSVDTYGSSWLQPVGNTNVGGNSAILTGRQLQFGGEFTF